MSKNSLDQPDRTSPLEHYQVELENLIASAEVDTDLSPQEVTALLHWIKAHAFMRIAERSIEALK